MNGFSDNINNNNNNNNWNTNQSSSSSFSSSSHSQSRPYNNNNNASSSSSSSSRRKLMVVAGGQKVWDTFRNSVGRRNLVPTAKRSQKGKVVAVGTQALAMERMKMNQKRFRYPKEGFVTPIEHSLLYAMICEPKIYPESVVLEQIRNETFNDYLVIADDNANANANATMTTTANNGGNGESDENAINSNERVSYAQLSALLALSIDNFPEIDKPESSPRSPPVTPSYNDNDDDDDDDDASRRRRAARSSFFNDNNNDDDDNPNKRIPQALCKAILSCVTKYADEHELNRATEVQELLEPVNDYMLSKSTQSLLPIYLTYAVGLFIPGGIGVGLTLSSLLAMIAASEKADQNASTIQKMNSQKHRVANMESASLLDEVEGY